MQVAAARVVISTLKQLLCLHRLLTQHLFDIKVLTRLFTGAANKDYFPINFPVITILNKLFFSSKMSKNYKKWCQILFFVSQSTLQTQKLQLITQSQSQPSSLICDSSTLTFSQAHKSSWLTTMRSKSVPDLDNKCWGIQVKPAAAHSGSGCRCHGHHAGCCRKGPRRQRITVAWGIGSCWVDGKAVAAQRRSSAANHGWARNDA